MLLYDAYNKGTNIADGNAVINSLGDNGIQATAGLSPTFYSFLYLLVIFRCNYKKQYCNAICWVRNCCHSQSSNDW